MVALSSGTSAELYWLGLRVWYVRPASIEDASRTVVEGSSARGFVELTVPKEQMSCDESSASSIEFWGQYVPPKISPEEGKALTGAGIDFPRTELESVHVRFEAKR